MYTRLEENVYNKIKLLIFSLEITKSRFYTGFKKPPYKIKDLKDQKECIILVPLRRSSDLVDYCNLPSPAVLQPLLARPSDSAILTYYQGSGALAQEIGG